MKEQGYGKTEQGLGLTMNAWAKALQNIRPELAKTLDQSRLSGFEGVVALGLPHHERKAFRLDSFMKDPDKYFQKFHSDHFYVYLKPLHSDNRPERITGATKKQATAFIQNKIKQADWNKYELQISDDVPDVYGGSVKIDSDSGVLVEFKKGLQGPIAAGTATPEYSAKSDPFTGTMRYDFDDEFLRKTTSQVLSYIPRDETQYLPGYYEFHLIQSSQDGPLEVKFFDYRSDPAFYSIPKPARKKETYKENQGG